MDIEELKLLKDKCLLFHKFLIEKANMPSRLFEESDMLLEKAYQERNVKKLKAASRDIDAQIRHLPKSLLSEFESLFKEKLNIKFETVDKTRNKAIEKVIKNGKIKNEEEFRLVSERVDEIYQDVSMIKELNRLNTLLVEFEKLKNNLR